MRGFPSWHFQCRKTWIPWQRNGHHHPTREYSSTQWSEHVENRVFFNDCRHNIMLIDERARLWRGRASMSFPLRRTGQWGNLIMTGRGRWRLRWSGGSGKCMFGFRGRLLRHRFRPKRRICLFGTSPSLKGWRRTWRRPHGFSSSHNPKKKIWLWDQSTRGWWH